MRSRWPSATSRRRARAGRRAASGTRTLGGRARARARAQRPLDQPLVVRGDRRRSSRRRAAPRARGRSSPARRRRPGTRSLAARRRCPCRGARSAGERRDVVERAPQRRLQHDADVVVPRLAQLAVERERVVGRGRVLHVDPHEAFVGAAAAITRSTFARQSSWSSFSPSAVELDADVRVEPVPLDLGEHLHVRVGDRLGLVRVRDLLAEHVDRRQLALRVQLGDDAPASSSVAPAM